MSYTKSPHFNVTRQVGGREASLAAYMRSVLIPGTTIDFRNRAREIAENAPTDFEWREFPVLVASGNVSFEFTEELGSGDLSNSFKLFGAERQFSVFAGIGDLYMRLIDVSFTPSTDTEINRVLFRGVNADTFSWSHGTRPVLYYDLYISDISAGTTVPDISGVNDSLYPWGGGVSTNSPTKLNLSDIVIGGEDSNLITGSTFNVRVPTTSYTMSGGTEYALHLVPLGAAGALGFNVDTSIPCDSSGTGSLNTNSIMMKTRYGADATGVLEGPLDGTSEQTDYYSDIVINGATDYLHYIQYDINGEPLDILDNTDANQIVIAGSANRTQGGAVYPLPFSYTLKYDNYAKLGKNVPESTVNFTLDDGRAIDTRQYRIVSESSSSRENNLDAYSTTIFMSEDICDTNFLTKVKYTRILNGETQINYKDIVDPQITAGNGVDYTYVQTVFGPYVTFATDGALKNLDNGDTVWVKKAPIDAISCLPPIGTETTAWKPRVQIGSFVAPQVSTDYGIKDIYYSIPEATGYPVAVNWAAGYGSPAASGLPYLSKATREIAYVIDPYTIQLPRRNVYFWDGDWGSGYSAGQWSYGENSYPDYQIPNIIDPPDVTGVASEAKWSHGINIYNGEELLDNDRIYGWNKRNGIIKLNRPLSGEHIVEATYLYEQKEIEVNVDLNPVLHHDNTNRVNDTVRVVLKPDWDTYSTDTGDTDSNKLAWHWLSENDTGEYIYDFAASSGTVGYSFVTGSGVGLPDHTVILGDYSIGRASPYEANLIDTRIRGGGIKEDVWFVDKRKRDNLAFATSPASRRRVQPESEYYWDIGYMDGEPYQADGSLVISIPSSVKTEIENRIIDASVGSTKITPEDKDLADSVFASEGEYNLETILSGISDEDRIMAIKLYIGIRDSAAEMAEEEIRSKIDKHIAFGEFYVLIDETTVNANTVTNASHRAGGRDRVGLPRVPRVPIGPTDPSREGPTSVRKSFHKTKPTKDIRGY